MGGGGTRGMSDDGGGEEGLLSQTHPSSAAMHLCNCENEIYTYEVAGHESWKQSDERERPQGKNKSSKERESPIVISIDILRARPPSEEGEVEELAQHSAILEDHFYSLKRENLSGTLPSRYFPIGSMHPLVS